MNCPNCATKMDNEAHIEGDIPATEYECPSCGYHTIWLRWQGWKVLFDPRDMIPDEYLNATGDDESDILSEYGFHIERRKI